MSLLFYAWGEPEFIFVMLVSILANYGFGLAVDKFRDKKAIARLVLSLMVIWNVSIFFTYKDALKWVFLQKENHNLYKWEILDFNTGAILDKGTIIDYD